jgi:hypothetical protein
MTMRHGADDIDRILKGRKPSDIYRVTNHADHQSQDCKSPWPHRATFAARGHRRGDRMTGTCCNAAMSPLGHKRSLMRQTTRTCLSVWVSAVVP